MKTGEHEQELSEETTCGGRGSFDWGEKTRVLAQFCHAYRGTDGFLLSSVVSSSSQEPV